MLHLCTFRSGIGCVVFGNNEKHWRFLRIFCVIFSLWEKDRTYNRKSFTLVQKVKIQYFEYSSTYRNVYMQHSQLSFKIKYAFAFYHIFLWMSFQVRISEDLSKGQWLFTLENAVQLWHTGISTDFAQLSVFQWSCTWCFMLEHFVLLHLSES